MLFKNESNSVRRLYNFGAPLYGFVDALLMPGNRRLAAQIKVLPAGALLEIGVGTGLRLPLFTGHKVTGIDLSEKMLQRARRRSPEGTLLQMDGGDLQFADAGFDSVVLAHVLSVAPAPNAVVAEAFRVLKPGGRLIIQNYFAPFSGGKTLVAISRLFHLRANFSLVSLPGLNRFQKFHEERFGPFGCFRLLVFQKP